MADLRLGAIEETFAKLIWKNEPISSRDLAEICERELTWKRTTTYNVLRKLCDKGIFQNLNGIVSAVIPQDDFYARRGEQFVAETYGGSLPEFIAAFTTRKKLTAEEADEIQRLIDDARREADND